MDNAQHPYGYLSHPTYEGFTLPYLHMNLEGGQLFFPTECKVPHEWTCYCHHSLFSLQVVLVLTMIHYFRVLSDIIVNTEQD